MDMTKEEFERQKAESAKRIKELYRGHNMPPYPEFVSVVTAPQPEDVEQHDRKPPEAKPALSQKSTDIGGLLKCFNMGEILKSPDSLLILGIIFLLLSDKSDEKLILALIFIML